MSNPLNPIIPILDLLGKELKILPATGGATEELQHPDQEEIEDTLMTKGTEQITAFAETPEPDIYNIYRPAPPLFRYQKHHFRFFVDGSIRTYFLGTGIEGTRSFPIELAQVGSAVIQRNTNGQIKVHSHKEIKTNLTRLTKGELLLSHPIYRQPVKIIFPKPAYRQQEA